MQFRDPFNEKAETLSDQEVMSSFRTMPTDKQLLIKLFDRSTRIIIGARGSGKSMLMKRALIEARQDEQRPLCIYINFQRYLSLEPYVYQSPQALTVFRDWVISKIFTAVVDEANRYGAHSIVLEAAGITQSGLKTINIFVEKLEGSLSGAVSIDFALPTLSVEDILGAIEALRSNVNRTRTVLLMDDAAHSFSAEFQEAFFDIFRLFRTENISSKASVYPGATQYGPTFNPGHDALETRVEREVEADDYEEFMVGILKARLSGTEFARLSHDHEMLSVLCYSASGNPRSVIVMAREVLESTTVKPKRNAYKEAIDSYCNSYLWKQHESLKRRLPRFRAQVTSGEQFVNKLVQELHSLNVKIRSRQTPYFAIEEGGPVEFTKMLSLLEYAGIVQFRGTVRRGRTRPLARYQLHLAVSISQGVFVGTQGAAVPVSAEQLRHLPKKRFKMFTQKSKELNGLLSSSDPYLPPCRKCGKNRLVSNARFCSYCGSELTEGSIYLELLTAPVNMLPVPDKKIRALKDVGLNTVRDLIMDSEGVRLRTAHRIADGWATRIRKMAAEFLEG